MRAFLGAEVIDTVRARNRGVGAEEIAALGRGELEACRSEQQHAASWTTRCSYTPTEWPCRGSGSMAVVPTVDTNEVAVQTDTSPVLGDSTAKMIYAIDREVERLVRLGLPVWVSRDGAIEDLNAGLVLTRQAETSKTA